MTLHLHNKDRSWTILIQDAEHASKKLLPPLERRGESVCLDAYSDQQIDAFLDLLTLTSATRHGWNERFDLGKLDMKVPLAIPLLVRFECGGVLLLIKSLLNAMPSSFPRAILSVFKVDADVSWAEGGAIHSAVEHCLDAGTASAAPAQLSKVTEERVSGLPPSAVALLLRAAASKK